MPLWPLCDRPQVEGMQTWSQYEEQRRRDKEEREALRLAQSSKDLFGSFEQLLEVRKLLASLLLQQPAPCLRHSLPAHTSDPVTCSSLYLLTLAYMFVPVHGALCTVCARRRRAKACPT